MIVSMLYILQAYKECVCNTQYIQVIEYEYEARTPYLLHEVLTEILIA